GFVLGALVERYTFISVLRYDFEWMLRPVVAILLLVSLYIIFADPIKWLFSRLSSTQKTNGSLKLSVLKINNVDLFFAVLIGIIFVYTFVTASEWSEAASLFPIVASVLGGLAIICVIIKGILTQSIDDSEGSLEGVSTIELVTRGLGFFGWAIVYLIFSQLLGMLLSLPILVFGLMYFQGRETVRSSLLGAGLLFVFSFALFHVMLSVPWPPAMLGELIPEAREYWITKIF
ncbi:MAG: tripartite tricarboxylate transporter TctB family protein, partial [Gammaproteobacteria bacterium]